MEAAQMKMGFCLALGQAGWHAPPEQVAIYYSKLAWHMATCAPAMGIVTQWAIRLQTSDFYGPSPPTPNTQAPHVRTPPPNIRLVDKWKMGKYGTLENVQHGGTHSTPPPVSNHKSAAPPPTRHIGISPQENGDKRAVPPPPPPQRHGNFTSGKWWVGENMPVCVHVMLFALLSLAAVGKVSKPRRGHPLVESLQLSVRLR